jgi:hypothetical protein
VATRREPLAASRDLERVRRRLRTVLDVGQRRHVADVRFYQLLSEADRHRAGRKNPGARR